MPRKTSSVLAVLFVAVGFAPITCVASSIAGLWSLRTAALFGLLPAIAMGLIVGFAFPRHGKLAATGLLFGMIAVFGFDCLTRFPLIGAGLIGDFIPNIGGWLRGTGEPDAAVGYLWRYLGNGGGMGLAFTVGYSLLRPPIECRRAGLLYGFAIWLGMLATVLGPNGEQMMFELNALTFVETLAGHLVFGGALGALLHFKDRRESSFAAEKQPVESVWGLAWIRPSSLP